MFQNKFRIYSDVFFLNLVFESKALMCSFSQNPIMLQPGCRAPANAASSMSSWLERGVAQETDQPLGTYLFLLAEIWCMELPYAPYSLLQSWFWSGLNRYPNTQPNRVFGALGILKMTPFFGKGRSSYKPSFCSVSRWFFRGVLIFNRIFSRRIGVFHPLILSQCNSPNFNFGESRI